MLTEWHRGLRHPLYLAYIVAAVTVAAALLMASLWMIRQLESHLQRIDMTMAVERLRQEVQEGRDVGRVDRFLHGTRGTDTFPAWMRGLEPGFHKLTHDEQVWHVMIQDTDGRRYALLRDYTDYEHGQSPSYRMIVLGLGVSLPFAFLLGALASRRFIHRLARLARQVNSRPNLPAHRHAHLPQAEDFWRDEIAELAQTLDETYHKLEQALERERLFTAEVSQEVRTPLSVVSSHAQQLRDDPALPPRQREQAQRIQQAAEEINQQLTAYLMLTRGSASDEGFPHIDTPTLAQEQAHAWQARAQLLDIRLQLVLPEEQTPVPLHPAPLLRVVLSNLVRNAIQHAGPGTTVVITAMPQGLEVQDDGVGIAQDRQATVFLPFVQGEPDEPSAELGLGLSLVQRICLQQGWRVTLESDEGVGCRFTVDLRGHGDQASQTDSLREPLLLAN